MTNTPRSEVVDEHNRVIDELSSALEGTDAGIIDVARQAFMQSRKPLLQWLVDQEVDAEIEGQTFTPSAEVQTVVDRDRELLERLLSMDRQHEENLRLAVREKVVAKDAAKPGRKPRSVREVSLDRAVIRRATEAIGRAQGLWDGKRTGTRKLGRTEYFDVMKPIIEAALARRDRNTLSEQEIAKASGLSFNLWNRIMGEFGDELCALATDTSEHAAENWVALCDRIGEAYLSASSREIIREVDTQLRRDRLR